MIPIHKVVEVSTSAGITLTGSAVGTAAAIAVNLPFFSPDQYAAAVAGAGLAELFKLVFPDSSEPPVEQIFRRAFKAALVWFMGSVFGLFMGGSFALLPVLDKLGGAFFAGMCGFGIMSVFANLSGAKRIGQALLNAVSGALEK
tara:strand:+ start:9981 stop:10412 length:432 start_codon:yes stop_codon:yes gene_type:complete